MADADNQSNRESRIRLWDIGLVVMVMVQTL